MTTDFLPTFIECVRAERRLRKAEGLPAHTPEKWHHNDVSMYRTAMLAVVSDPDDRAELQRRYRIKPISSIGLRAAHAEARMAEIRHGKAHTKTPDNSVPISEYRKGDLDDPVVEQVALASLLSVGAAAHPKATGAPYGVVWHAKYIAKHGRFWRPPVLVCRSRVPFFADGNHRFIAALLATDCVGTASVVAMHKQRPTSSVRAIW